jgi:Holliday junction resolvasome RuvABC endonuclease subunit
MGWALLEINNVQPSCLGASTIRTKPNNTLKRCDDNDRRCGEITRALLDLYKKHDFILIAAEAQSWTSFHKADRQVAMAWGVISALAEFHAMPVIQIRPQEIKGNITNDKSASKGAVESVLRNLCPGAGHHFDQVIKSQRNHAADALAVAWASMDHALIRAVQNVELRKL